MSSTSEESRPCPFWAISVGPPSIVTNVGGMAEVVRNANAGITSPVGDSDAMAESIVQLSHPIWPKKGSCWKCSDAYRQQFTLEYMEASYMKLYELQS